MVDRKYIEDQLKKIGFVTKRFNKPEVRELEEIIHPDEQIYECVNGFYEGGVGLLVATDSRVLLIDKKPMGFLNVDDLRFDMICDLDYSHRMFGAQIKISAGNKDLLFKSYNQSRLRKLIGHVQQRMSELKNEQHKHAQSQKQHLEDINRQLQMYLLAQHQHLQQQLATNRQVTPLKPNPELSDYLFAQRLMEDFQQQNPNPPIIDAQPTTAEPKPVAQSVKEPTMEELVKAAREEVLGKRNKQAPLVDMTAFRIAIAKLPQLLQAKKVNRPFIQHWQFKR